jgi:hypothetical protein
MMVKTVSSVITLAFFLGLTALQSSEAVSTSNLRQRRSVTTLVIKPQDGGHGVNSGLVGTSKEIKIVMEDESGNEINDQSSHSITVTLNGNAEFNDESQQQTITISKAGVATFDILDQKAEVVTVTISDTGDSGFTAGPPVRVTMIPGTFTFFFLATYVWGGRTE